MSVDDISKDKFKPISSGELVTKGNKFEFHIPSFQRGYRWKKAQVEDMLNDLFDFVSYKNPFPAYFLQPLVVRNLETKLGKKNSWEVLDGQQRLTTLLLILQEFIKMGVLSCYALEFIELYNLIYDEREEISFENPDSTQNMDAYYVSNAKNVISEWFEQKRKLNDKQIGAQIELMAKILFGFDSDDKKNVKFIWYVIDETNSYNIQKESIAIFNRLNNGKLKLTPSELIKALFILAEPDAKRRTIFSMEWNQIEKTFEEDEFFATLARRGQNFDTRIDLLFNFASGIGDSEACYRHYQNLYKEDPDKFPQLWDKIKREFDRLMSWYQITELRNLIGYLCYTGKSTIWKIKEEIEKKKTECNEVSWTHSNTIDVIKSMIKAGLRDIRVKGSNQTISFPEAVNYINYTDNKDLISNVLLLFNVITSNISDSKFRFNRLREENWDIEHVDSQTENPMQENSDKKIWLDSVLNVLENQIYQLEANKRQIEEDKFHEGIENYLDKGKRLHEKGESLQKEYDSVSNGRYDAWSKSFNEWYSEILNHFGPIEKTRVRDQQEIGNLVLLDDHTNRSYGNALFIEKSHKIIERDTSGKFVPEATKNVFLKYYSHKDSYIGKGNDIVWTQDDATAYQYAIFQSINDFMK